MAHTLVGAALLVGGGLLYIPVKTLLHVEEITKDMRHIAADMDTTKANMAAVKEVLTRMESGLPRGKPAGK